MDNRWGGNKNGTADPNWPRGYSIPHNVSCSAVNLGGTFPGVATARLGIGWLVTGFASLSPTLFYSLTCLYLNSWVFSLLPNFFPYPAGAEQASGCMLLSCLLGFILICLGTHMLSFCFPKIRLFSTNLHQPLTFLQLKAAFCVLIPYIKSFLFWSLWTSRRTLVSSRMQVPMSSLHNSSYWIVFQFSMLSAFYNFCDVTAVVQECFSYYYCTAHFFKSDCFSTYLSWLF